MTPSQRLDQLAHKLQAGFSLSLPEDEWLLRVAQSALALAARYEGRAGDELAVAEQDLLETLMEEPS